MKAANSDNSTGWNAQVRLQEVHQEIRARDTAGKVQWKFEGIDPDRCGASTTSSGLLRANRNTEGVPEHRGGARMGLKLS